MTTRLADRTLSIGMLALALSGALSGALLDTAGPAAAAAQDQAAVNGAATLAVTAQAVRLETMRTQVSGTGLIVAWQEAAISTSASGLAITEVLVSQGDRVAAGAVVARLDDALLKAEVAEKQAALDSAEATYASAVTSNDRGQRLSQSGALTSETLEQRATAVRTSGAAVAVAKAQLETLKVQLDRTVVTAPFAGTVSAEPAVVGTIVQTGSEIVRLQRDGRLRARIDVPEQHLAALASGNAAEITGPDGQTIAGRLAQIAETVNTATHLGSVDIDLPAGTPLKAGMFVRASIAAGGEAALSVPEAALTWRDGRTCVFTVGEDGKVSLVPVVIGTRQDGRVAVTGDLTPSSRVVTRGAGFLSGGNIVRVVTEAAAAADSTQAPQ